jgi:hypothetical protein
MIRVIRNVKDGLNVWADNKKNTQCYANDDELRMLFLAYVVEAQEQFDEPRIQDFEDLKTLVEDFMATLNRLNEFYFEARDVGVCYYRPVAEVE